MRPRIPLLLTIGVGLLLSVLGGCGGSTDHSSKPASDHATGVDKESLPKPPKPDPG